MAAKPNTKHNERMRRLARQYERASLPLAIFFLLNNRQFHPSYRMTWRRKIVLGLRLYRNFRSIQTGISYKAHLAMASKLLELPPSAEGVVVECGSWVGGTTANLSVICDLVGRDLIVYDSFEGLPAPEPLDNITPFAEGSYKGTLEEVQANVRRHGVLARCTFRKGWFKDTLPHHREPIALCLIDVDFKSSMHDCLVNLWPHLRDDGYVFFDEYQFLHNCALFYSERFWRDYLDTTPPGLMGAGTGIGLGQYFVGPRKGPGAAPPVQRPSSIGYTRKSFSGLWDYDPDG